MLKTIGRWFWKRVKLQPVATAVLVRGALLIGMAFGLNLTVTQLAVIYPWVEGVIAWATYSAVTPNAQVDAKVAAGVAAAQATP